MTSSEACSLRETGAGADEMLKEVAAVTNRHVFCHAPTDTILAFGRQTGELVTPADMLSTEVHLHARGISEEPLESLLSAAVLGK